MSKNKRPKLDIIFCFPTAYLLRVFLLIFIFVFLSCQNKENPISPKEPKDNIPDGYILTGRVLWPDKTPCAEGTVYLFAPDAMIKYMNIYSLGRSSLNNDGEYFIKPPAAGIYNLYVSTPEFDAAFMDSINFLDTGTLELNSFILKPLGETRFQVYFMNYPDSIRPRLNIYTIGAPYYMELPVEGYDYYFGFIMPEGSYTLKIVPLDYNLMPIEIDFPVISDSIIDLDSLPIYSYDIINTLNSMISDSAYSINDTIHLNGNSALLNMDITDWQWDFGNTGTFISSSSGDTSIMAPSEPVNNYQIILKLSINRVHIYDTISIDILLDAPVVIAGPDTAVSINDSVFLYASIQDSFGTVIYKAWDIGCTGHFNSVQRLDTVITAPAIPDSAFKCVFKAIDDDSNIVYDTLGINVLLDPPLTDAGRDTTVSIGDTIYLKGSAADSFGTIIKWRWYCGDTSISYNAKDTFVIAPLNTANPYSCVLSVTDDDGNISYASKLVYIRPKALNIISIDSSLNTITINFNKTQNAFFSKYHIYFSKDSTVNSNDELWAELSDISDTSVTSPQSFAWNPGYYRVYQINGQGLLGDGSNIVYGNIKNTPPAQPSIVYPSNNGVEIWSDDILSWSCSDVNTGQSIYYRILANHKSTGYNEFNTAITDTFIALKGNFDSLDLAFKVIAYNDGNDSSTWSEERSLFIKNSLHRGMKLINSGYFIDDVYTYCGSGLVGDGTGCDTAYISYDFWMDSTEVTQKDFARLLNYNNSGFKGDNKPVNNITWYEAILYCNERSKSSGLDTVYEYISLNDTIMTDSGLVINVADMSYIQCRWDVIGYRLPTDDEWELAARCDMQLEFSTSDGTLSINNANFSATSIIDVASYPPNPNGIYDMTGNVKEFVWDIQHMYRINNRIDLRGTYDQLTSKTRGGGFNYAPSRCRVAYRQSDGKGTHDENMGFRCVINSN